MKYVLVLIADVCCLSYGALAQLPYSTSIQPATVAHEIPVNRGSAALWQSLKKLHTRASLIMITAHPDDEDGGMLTYESRGQGARVTLLTLNRGEGGANVMSPDYFDALGLVRTMELLAAGRYYGVDQYWTRVIDYGFSKTKAESIRMWTHDRVLYDVVRVVREVRPLVITSVFVGGPERWTWQSPDCRRHGSGSVQSRRRSQGVSGSDRGRPAALDAFERLCSRAHGPPR